MGNWWYFPLKDKNRLSRYYPIHKDYIKQFYSNLKHLTTKEAVDVMIKSVYECIVCEGIDH